MKTGDEIELLVRSFEELALPRSEWTHQAHLTVALVYLRRHPREEATHLIRNGIQRYNAVYGRAGAYHETVTLAWAARIARFLRERDRGQPLSELVESLLAECGEKDALLRFYSEDVLMSDEARRAWVPPNLCPIEPEDL